MEPRDTGGVPREAWCQKFYSHHLRGNAVRPLYLTIRTLSRAPHTTTEEQTHLTYSMLHETKTAAWSVG